MVSKPQASPKRLASIASESRDAEGAGYERFHPHMTKTALISGITGQDGSFLAELLLEKDYQVYGIIRRSSSFNTDRIDHLYRIRTRKARASVWSTET